MQLSYAATQQSAIHLPHNNQLMHHDGAQGILYEMLFPWLSSK